MEAVAKKSIQAFKLNSNDSRIGTFASEILLRLFEGFVYGMISVSFGYQLG